MAAHNELGILGENIAAKRLSVKGYEILERQWHYKHKEIDIIARKGNILAIMEVKTRSSEQFGGISDFITSSKMEFLTEASEIYAKMIGFNGDIRFDVVCVFVIGDEYRVEHIENAFVSQ